MDIVFSDDCSFTCQKLSLLHVNEIGNFCFRCGSLIFELELMFSTEVAEDDIIHILRTAVREQKFGGLSINASSIIGIPPVVLTTTTSSTTTATKPDTSMFPYLLFLMNLRILVFLVLWQLQCTCWLACCFKWDNITPSLKLERNFICTLNSICKAEALTGVKCN